MLPPILEIYVVWHPADPAGRVVAGQLLHHFYGPLYSGLIGGAVEVYIRSEGWRASDDAPRPIPLPSSPPPNGVAQAQLTIIVPVLGNEFAAVVPSGKGGWRERRPSQASEKPRLHAGLAKLDALTRAESWNGLDNGLIDEENQRLVVSHRPIDIAALGILDLGRRSGQEKKQPSA